MAIELIQNQAINFKLVTDGEDCDCRGGDYCQKINKNDITKFQIKSNSILENGDFNNDLEGWEIKENLGVSVSITNVSFDGDCDGELEINASGGTAPYEYSINGGAFQISNTFNDLCEGCYTITVKDADNNLGFASACIDKNVDCSAFDMTDELLPYTTAQFLNCLTSDFI